jgi:ABC-2 type transport system ATP-binding protein
LITTLRAEGVAVVLTTHFLDEAEQLADTVVVIDGGIVVASGTPAELTRAGAEGQVRFRSPVGLAVDRLCDALPSGSTVIEQEPGRYLVTGDVNPQLLAALTAWCAEQGVFTEDLSVQRRTLEDVFLELTGQATRP